MMTDAPWTTGKTGGPQERVRQRRLLLIAAVLAAATVGACGLYLAARRGCQATYRAQPVCATKPGALYPAWSGDGRTLAACVPSWAATQASVPDRSGSIVLLDIGTGAETCLPGSIPEYSGYPHLVCDRTAARLYVGVPDEDAGEGASQTIAVSLWEIRRDGPSGERELVGELPRAVWLSFSWPTEQLLAVRVGSPVSGTNRKGGPHRLHCYLGAVGDPWTHVGTLPNGFVVGEPSLSVHGDAIWYVAQKSGSASKAGDKYALSRFALRGGTSKTLTAWDRHRLYSPVECPSTPGLIALIGDDEAYEGGPDPPSASVLLIDTRRRDRKPVTLISRDAFQVGGLAWSPDGSLLAYVSRSDCKVHVVKVIRESGVGKAGHR